MIAKSGALLVAASVAAGCASDSEGNSTGSRGELPETSPAERGDDTGGAGSGAGAGKRGEGGESAEGAPPEAGAEALPTVDSPTRAVTSQDGVETTIHEVEETPTPELLPVAEVERLRAAETAALVDVNAPEARHYYGVIPGAIELTHPIRFERKELPDDRDKPLIFYCATPSCGASTRAGTRALLEGYEEVYALRGGVERWRDAGGEIDAP